MFKLKWLPLHIRGVLYFLFGKKTLMTEEHITNEETYLLFFLLNTEFLYTNEFKISYEWFNSHINNLRKKESIILKRWKLLLGRAVAYKKSDGSIEIKDIYDFNDAVDKKFSYLFKKLIKSIIKFNFKEILENIIKLRHSNGYPGFEIKILLK